MFFNYVIFFLCITTVCCKSLPQNNTSIISTYAKVAHWGAASTNPARNVSKSEGRSHNGQALWTHRSDVNIIGGQKLKPKPAVVYHYAVPKVGSEKVEVVPAVGEVQERFNPRPYFDYSPAPSKNAKSESKTKTKSEPAPATFDSFPVFNKPSASSSPTDLYSSSYSSYNPPVAGPVGPISDSKTEIPYPPNAPSPPDNTEVSDSSDDNSHNGYSYDPPQDASFQEPQGPPSYPSLGPPLAYPGENGKPQSHNYENHGQAYYYSSDNHGNDHDTKNNEQVYYPPSEDGHHHETILDYPPPGWKEPKPDMDSGDSPKNMNGHGAMNGNGGDLMDDQDNSPNGHDMGEQDLSPPPSPDLGGQFPHYLYSDPQSHGHDFGGYDFDHHHVYKEITTTTEAPEDERVNKGHYSYYYLGRKLWYIPLYFSVYFIIYVAVLILKSIARHKVQLKHEHFTRDNHARQLDLDDIHKNVSTAIETSRKKFVYVAM